MRVLENIFEVCLQIIKAQPFFNMAKIFRGDRDNLKTLKMIRARSRVFRRQDKSSSTTKVKKKVKNKS